MSQNLALRSTVIGEEVSIWDSQQRRFLTGGVTIDSDLVSADGDGNKYVYAGQVIGLNAATALWGPVADPVAATKATGVAASNNALLFTAVNKGAAGNAVKVQLEDPSGNNQALAVSIVADTVKVSLATSAEGAITSTANEVAAAVNAHLMAKQLVTASAEVGESTGEAAVAAVAAGALSGGKDPVLLGDVAPSRYAMAAENFDVTSYDKLGSAVDHARVRDARVPTMSDEVKALVPDIIFV